MSNYYYGVLELQGAQEALDELAAQLKRLEECCRDYGGACSDYLPAILADYPLEERVFCDGWWAEPGHLEIYIRGQGTVGNRFAAILCQSLGLSGTLSIEEELGDGEQFKFSFERATPICTLRELGS